MIFNSEALEYSPGLGHTAEVYSKERVPRPKALDWSIINGFRIKQRATTLATVDLVLLNGLRNAVRYGLGNDSTDISTREKIDH